MSFPARRGFGVATGVALFALATLLGNVWLRLAYPEPARAAVSYWLVVAALSAAGIAAILACVYGALRLAVAGPTGMAFHPDVPPPRAAAGRDTELRALGFAARGVVRTTRRLEGDVLEWVYTGPRADVVAVVGADGARLGFVSRWPDGLALLTVYPSVAVRAEESLRVVPAGESAERALGAHLEYAGFLAEERGRPLELSDPAVVATSMPHPFEAKPPLDGPRRRLLALELLAISLVLVLPVGFLGLSALTAWPFARCPWSEARPELNFGCSVWRFDLGDAAGWFGRSIAVLTAVLFLVFVVVLAAAVVANARRFRRSVLRDAAGLPEVPLSPLGRLWDEQLRLLGFARFGRTHRSESGPMPSLRLHYTDPDRRCAVTVADAAFLSLDTAWPDSTVSTGIGRLQSMRLEHAWIETVDGDVRAAFERHRAQVAEFGAGRGEPLRIETIADVLAAESRERQHLGEVDRWFVRRQAVAVGPFVLIAIAVLVLALR